MNALPPAGGSTEYVPNNLVWAILTTLFCCLPLGIVSIVHAAKVNNMLAAGDFEGAQRASANAKTWCWVATGLAIVGLLWSIYFFSSGGMAEYQEMIEQFQHMQ